MPDWYLSDSAVKAMARILRLRDDDESLRRAAESRLRELVGVVRLVRRDSRSTRELHRDNRTGTRLVVDYRSDAIGKVIWVGNSRPPENVWSEPEPQAEPAVKQCPHLPTLGSVYEVRMRRVSTPRHEMLARSQPWIALICAQCAEAVRLRALARTRDSDD